MRKRRARRRRRRKSISNVCLAGGRKRRNGCRIVQCFYPKTKLRCFTSLDSPVPVPLSMETFFNGSYLVNTDQHQQWVPFRGRKDGMICSNYLYTFTNGLNLDSTIVYYFIMIKIHFLYFNLIFL